MNFKPYICLTIAALFPFLTGCAGKSPAPAASQAPRPESLARPLETEGITPNRLALARNLVDQQFYEVALVQLQAAIKERGRDALAYDLAGVCARELGDPKKAENYLKKANDLDPNNASVHNNLGILYSITEEPEKASKHFRQAVLLDPGRPDFINNLGYFHLGQKQYPEAEKTLRRALTLDPDFRPALNNLIISLGLQHKDSQAMDLLLSHMDQETAWHNMACIYRMRNEPQKAEKLKNFIRTPEKSKASAFDTQAENGKTRAAEAPGLPGQLADTIYGDKYQKALETEL